MGGLSYIFWANGLRERELELSVANSLTQCVLVLSLCELKAQFLLL